MKDFKYRQGQLGALVRYINAALGALFISQLPMPFAKAPLAWLCAGMFAVNAAYHAYITATKRTVAATYAISAVELLAMLAAVFLTGGFASPFLVLIPLLFFTVYFANLDERATLTFAGAAAAGLLIVGLAWSAFGNPVPGWSAQDYTGFAVLLLVMQMLTFGAFAYLAIQTNPFVQEIGRQERVIAQQQNRAELGTALAMITHEIRTPLTTAYLSIDGAAQNLKRLARGGRAKAQRQLQVTKQELKRVSEMLESVLSFAREKRGQYRPAGHMLRPIIERALAFLTLKYGRHAVRFDADLVIPAGQTMWCDADAMHQVLVNLLDNAVQHRSADRPLRLEFTTMLREGRVALTVRDNGRGIPEARVSRVFEHFVTGRDGGTGLGLAIVRQIIEDHGGGIEVQSTEGAGTSFTLLMPPAGAAGQSESVLAAAGAAARTP